MIDEVVDSLAGEVAAPEISNQTNPKWNATDIAPGNRRFVVILPASTPSPSLCKTITSAIALGYPMPVIVNWEVNFLDVLEKLAEVICSKSLVCFFTQMR